jgi:enoyl-CoA hydratase
VLVLVEAGPVARVTLNRPEKRNALSAALQAELVAALEQLAIDDDVRVVVLTGAGPHFCAGHDLTEATSDGSGDGASHSEAYFELARRFYLPVSQFPKPLVVAAQGFVGPAAAEILLLADFAVIGRSTVISYEMLRAGGVTPSLTLPWVVGPRQAKRILMTAPRIAAEEALALGMVTAVVDDGALLERATALGELLAAMPPLHQRVSKLIANQAMEAMGASPVSALAATAEALLRAALPGVLTDAAERGVREVVARQHEQFEQLVRAWAGQDDES